MVSYALRDVFDSGCEAPLGNPRCNPKAGSPRRSSAATPAINRGFRMLTTKRPHRAPSVRCGVKAATCAVSFARSNGVGMNFATRSPAKPSNAGSKVSAISNAISTETAAASPM